VTTTRISERKSYPVELPRIPIPPGDSIMLCAEERELSPQVLAEELKLTSAALGELLCGDLPISEAIAISLEVLFGADADFWLRLEAQYREDLAFQAASIAAPPKRKRA